MNFYRSARRGRLVCETEMLNRGRTLANLESKLYLDGTLVASANGNYAVIPKRESPP